MKNFREYLKTIRARGDYTFTTNQAARDLSISRNAVNCGVYKLKKQGDIVSPTKGLYLVVPPEHQSLGCLPAEELLPIIMKHWNLPYYVCLLTAAYYHGASHQKPQTFQVMVQKQLKPIVCGKVKIEFLYKQSLANLPTQQRIVKTGYLTIATPELTAMDLLLYPRRVGGLNAIATVLAELVDLLQPESLKKIMTEATEQSWIQRLGYLLEQLEGVDPQQQQLLLTEIQQYLHTVKMLPVRLASELPKQGANYNARWNIIENTTIESDV